MWFFEQQIYIYFCLGAVYYTCMVIFFLSYTLSQTCQCSSCWMSPSAQQPALTDCHAVQRNRLHSNKHAKRRKEANNLQRQFPAPLQGCMELSQEKGAVTWLTALHNWQPWVCSSQVCILWCFPSPLYRWPVDLINHAQGLNTLTSRNALMNLCLLILRASIMSTRGEKGPVWLNRVYKLLCVNNHISLIKQGIDVMRCVIFQVFLRSLGQMNLHHKNNYLSDT